MAEYAVCWFIECEAYTSTTMIKNISYGICRSDYFMYNAYQACYARDTDLSLSTLNFINFGMDYMCRNITPEYLEYFQLTETEYYYIMYTRDQACYAGDQIDYWIEYVTAYGVPDDFDCPSELNPFVQIRDAIEEVISWYYDSYGGGEDCGTTDDTLRLLM